MKKLIGLYRLIPSAIMLFIVFYPFVANMFFSNSEVMDNRPLHEKPTKFSSDFAKDYEAYYNDTFAGRKKVISKYVKLQKKLKIDTGQYFYGNDGWIFYDSIKANNGNTLLDYYAEVYFDEDDLKKMLEGINMAKDFYAKQGIKYMVVVAPNKENIYSEFMPDRMQKIRKSDVSRMDAAVSYLKDYTDVKLLNLKPAVLQAKSEVAEDLYYHKDTHWNFIGGYVGFESLAKEINKLGFNVKADKLTPSMISFGELRNMDMEAGAKEWAYDVSYRKNLHTECTKNEGNEAITVCKTKGTGNPGRLLIFVDSFSEYLMPYLNKSFDTVYYVPAGSKKLSEIKSYVEIAKPDLVIDELVERYFSRYINYPRVFGGDYD